MADYKLTKLVTDIHCPGNVVQADDAGLPSLLVYIPAFKNSDVLAGGDSKTHPAFVVNGTEIPGFYYSKYQNAIHGGLAYSLPGEEPATGASFEDALTCTEEKGHGWHLATAAEWAAIALWCKKNGYQPSGNNDHGKDSRETGAKAIPATTNTDGTTAKVATGTGPISWSHDGTPSGIWDLNGNVQEWQGGLRIVWGEIQILANNDAADPDNPQNNTSTVWKAINAADGTLVEPECTMGGAAVLSGATLRLDYVGGVWTYGTAITSASATSRGCSFGAVTCTAAVSDAAKALLRSLALLPDTGATEEDYDGDMIWINNGGAEFMASRGGNWATGESGGVFYLNAGNARTSTGAQFGFRATYTPALA